MVNFISILERWQRYRAGRHPVGWGIEIMVNPIGSPDMQTMAGRIGQGSAGNDSNRFAFSTGVAPAQLHSRT